MKKNIPFKIISDGFMAIDINLKYFIWFYTTVSTLYSAIANFDC